MTKFLAKGENPVGKSAHSFGFQFIHGAAQHLVDAPHQPIFHTLHAGKVQQVECVKELIYKAWQFINLAGKPVGYFIKNRNVAAEGIPITGCLYFFSYFCEPGFSGFFKNGAKIITERFFALLIPFFYFGALLPEIQALKQNIPG